MKKITLLIALLITGFGVKAQDYATPNSGVNYSLEDLLTENPDIFSFEEDYYIIHEGFTLSENDTLSLNEVKVKIAGDVRIYVEGTFLSYGSESENNIIDALDEENPYNGIRFEEIAKAEIDRTTLKNGGGLKIITPDFSITNSLLIHNVKGAGETAVLSLSHGSVLIENNEFIENDMPAVASPANGDVSAHIINNYLEGNSQLNQNRPQLNMGPTGADTLKIIGNTIIGDRDLSKVGGISVAALLGGQVQAIIQDNIIQDNRFGINLQGGAGYYAEVIDNIIEDNDTEGNPNLGGSGISINSSSEDHISILSGNEIRRNIWGITIIGSQQGAPTVNLGDDEENPGNNIFSENGNNGTIYALYNNSTATVMAKHNCWIEGQESTLEEAGEVIVDQEDDDALGEVIYDPINCGVLSVPSLEKNQITLYPNPAVDEVYFDNSIGFEQVSIYDLNGRKVLENQLTNGENQMQINLNSGVYLMKFEGENGKLTKKLIVK